MNIVPTSPNKLDIFKFAQLSSHFKSEVPEPDEVDGGGSDRGSVDVVGVVCVSVGVGVGVGVVLGGGGGASSERYILM